MSPGMSPAMNIPAPGDAAALVLSHAPPQGFARPGMQTVEEHEHWPLLSRIPMRLTAGVPIERFKVRDLLALRPGAIVATTWPSTEDVPLQMGAVQLSWSEFEVVEGRMAIRLTRLG